MKKLNIVKRSVPVLIASMAVSTLYMGGAQASADEQTVYIEDIADVVEFGAGYYENPTFVRTNLTAPDQFVASPYADGNNDLVTGEALTDAAVVALDDYKSSDEYSISVGVDEQITLTPGYYYNNINIKNGVKDNGDPSEVLDGDHQSVDLTAGYYSDGTVKMNETWNNLITALNTTFGTSFTGEEKFLDISEQLSGENFALNNTGTALYSLKDEGDNTRIGTSPSVPKIEGVELAGETIDLGVDETVVIPAGYYSEEITIKSGVLHKDDVNAVVSADNDETYGSKRVEFGPGYYDSIVVEDNTSSGVITKTNLEGTMTTWDATSNTWH